MNRPIRFGLVTLSLVLAGALRADDNKPAPAAAPDDSSVRADNKQLTDELASSWKETDKLKTDLSAAQSAVAKNALEIADLKTQLDSAKAQPAPDAGGSIADLQEKLATSLRSFTVLQDENAQLRASVDKLTGDTGSLSQELGAAKGTIATLQVQAAATSEIEPLRTELRQAQDEASHLAAENADLRTRLALQATGPSSLKPAPTRPGTAEAMAAATPVPPAAPAVPEAKTYVVAEGDTLTKISRKFYGTSGRWEDILKANHDVLKNEKSLVVGSTIKIP